jgi:hypothetical protein
MKTRGPDSAAARAVITGDFAERPKPPSKLTKRQKEIWQEVVSSENPEFFKSGTLRQLLGDYCQRRASCEEITAVIEEFGPGWKDDPETRREYSDLLRMRDREMIAHVALATKLRLTNQSRYVPDTAARVAAKRTRDEIPWRASA